MFCSLPARQLLGSRAREPRDWQEVSKSIEANNKGWKSQRPEAPEPLEPPALEPPALEPPEYWEPPEQWEP